MKFRTIYIENRVKNRKLTTDILKRITYQNIKVISSLKAEIPFINFQHSIGEQKKDLILADNTGTFIKKCIRDKEDLREHEYFLYLSTGCNMDCQYCYLQDYLDVHMPVVFVNQKAFFQHIRNFLTSNKSPIIHAGEVCDPFVMERIAPFLENLVKIFSEFPHARLEIRSKTLPPPWLSPITGSANITFSMTLSPQDDIHTYEKKTAALKRRIQALNNFSRQGFSIGLRFDPVIYTNDFDLKYKNLFQSVFQTLSPESVSSVTIGALRFTRGLYKTVRERFPESRMPAEEFLLSPHHKIKYFLPFRTRIYTELSRSLKSYFAGDLKKKVSFCMDKDLEREILK